MGLHKEKQIDKQTQMRIKFKQISLQKMCGNVM
jgi:hypothetical protein